MIKWNDGLNLGVKVLDDDHKKLLDIISNLSQAIDDNREKDVIDNTFSDLERYAKEHFKREESLLKKCKYIHLNEHADSHDSFGKKIPELKAKLHNPKDKTSAKEIVSFLHDWVLNHIVEEDIPIISMFEKCGVCEKPTDTQSWSKKLINKITDTFSFTNKLLFSTLIPLGGMLALIFIILLNNYNKHEETLKTATITNMLSNINNLVHVIQIERGLSCGYISSVNNKFKNDLDKQRNIVNNSIESFNHKMQIIDSNKILSIKVNIDNYKRDILALKNLRKRVDIRDVSNDVTIEYYSRIIKNILNITSKIAMLEPNSELSSLISTLSSLLYYKETLGIKRALGTIIIEHNTNEMQDNIKFIKLTANEELFLNYFNNTATNIQITSLNSILESEIAKKIDIYKAKLEYGDVKSIDSIVWFDSTSELINNIKIFENKLLYETEALVKDILDEEVNTLFLWLIYTTFIFLCTMFFIYIFVNSSREEINNFIDAIEDLAHGGRAIRLTNATKKDEIGHMYNAYELTRQKLLKADIYIQLYLDKKELELQEQQKENLKLEEMASIDSLTGCINRRRFDEVANLELSRAIRYKSGVSFLMLDIDHFKAVNDTYGHGIGDEVLKHFSSVCLDMARNLDIVARVGGEEFVVILPQTNSEGAFIFAERFREKISNSILDIENHTIKYSVSIGIATLDETIKDVTTILQKADNALYKAKELGRNRSIIYDA